MQPPFGALLSSFKPFSHTPSAPLPNNDIQQTTIGRRCKLLRQGLLQQLHHEAWESRPLLPTTSTNPNQLLQLTHYLLAQQPRKQLIPTITVQPFSVCDQPSLSQILPHPSSHQYISFTPHAFPESMNHETQDQHQHQPKSPSLRRTYYSGPSAVKNEEQQQAPLQTQSIYSKIMHSILTQMATPPTLTLSEK
jgi:hypothetical protein